MVITEIKDLPHTGLNNTQTQPGLMLGSQTQCTQVTLPDWATFSSMILKNLKLCAFGYDFFQMTTHNPGLFV
jgi:hypothetical protein